MRRHSLRQLSGRCCDLMTRFFLLLCRRQAGDSISNTGVTSLGENRTGRTNLADPTEQAVNECLPLPLNQAWGNPNNPIQRKKVYLLLGLHNSLRSKWGSSVISGLHLCTLTGSFIVRESWDLQVLLVFLTFKLACKVNFNSQVLVTFV